MEFTIIYTTTLLPVSNYFCNFAPQKADNSTTQEHRDVAQSGLEYSSGGRVVASSNLVIPTTKGKDCTSHLSLFWRINQNGGCFRERTPLLQICQSAIIAHYPYHIVCSKHIVACWFNVFISALYGNKQRRIPSYIQFCSARHQPHKVTYNNPNGKHQQNMLLYPCAGILHPACHCVQARIPLLCFLLFQSLFSFTVWGRRNTHPPYSGRVDFMTLSSCHRRQSYTDRREAGRWSGLPSNPCRVQPRC